MRCQQFTAQEALEMGLVNAVVPQNQLESEVERWCDDLKAVSPTIIQLQKINFNEASDHMRIPSPTERYAPHYLNSEEAHERRTAFLQRRKPDPSKNLPIKPIAGKTL